MKQGLSVKFEAEMVVASGRKHQICTEEGAAIADKETPEKYPVRKIYWDWEETELTEVVLGWRKT